MRNQNENSLGDIVKQFTEEYRLKDKLNQVEVIRIWEICMGPMILKNTREVRFKDGVLTVRIESAPLKQELEFRKNQIITRLNEEMGIELVKEVMIR
jgi:predicted nucleic acid-binding Zn ribbon protein